MSTLETNLVQPSTGTNLQLGASGDTVDIPAGATLDVTGATVTGLSAGKVLQTVSTSYATAETTTGTTYVDTSLTATITPASSSNKILIWVSTSWGTVHASNPSANARIYNSTDAVAIADTLLQGYNSAGGTVYQYAPLSIIGEDTGRSVATTYLLQQKASSAGRDSRVNNTYTGWIILMEIEA